MVPGRGFGIVLGHSLPCVMHVPERVLSDGVSLFGGAAEPLRDFPGQGRRDVVARRIFYDIPSFGVSLFSGAAEPLHGFGIVLGNSDADSVHDRYSVLSFDVSLFGDTA